MRRLPIKDVAALTYYKALGKDALGEAVIDDVVRGPLPWALVPDRLGERCGYVVLIDLIDNVLGVSECR